MPKYAQALFWTDFETTGLPEGNDFSNVHILEVAVVVTNFDLEPLAGYKEVVKLTRAGADALRGNEYVLNMHKNSGLLQASAKEATATEADVEQEIIKLFKEATTFDAGEFMIAGSGVAAFDHPLIKQRMPELAKWLAYYPFDIGVQRRVAQILGKGRQFINPVAKSFQDGVKAHRAWDDVQAHIEEGRRWMEFYRGLPE